MKTRKYKSTKEIYEQIIKASTEEDWKIEDIFLNDKQHSYPMHYWFWGGPEFNRHVGMHFKDGDVEGQSNKLKAFYYHLSRTQYKIINELTNLLNKKL